MIGALSAASEVWYPSSADDNLGVPLRITIVDEVNRHRLFYVEHSGAPQKFTRNIITGAPLGVNTSSRMGTRAWHGYVVDVSPGKLASTGSDSEGTLITGLGVTYPAKRSSDKVYRNGTVAEYLSSIVYSLGLTPYVEDLGLLQTVPQAGRTDWQVIDELARLSGLDVFVTGTTVNALTPNEALRSFYSEAAVLTNVTGEDLLDFPDALEGVTYSDNRLSESGSTARSVEPTTGRVMTAFDVAGPFPRVNGNIVARSLPTLRSKVGGVKRISEMPISAKVTGPGNILVGAGRPVFLNDQGDQHWWLVESVTHTFVPPTGEYSMTAMLRRASTLQDVGPPLPYPQKNTLRHRDNYCMCREHDPLLVNRWRADYVTRQVSSPKTDPVYSDDLLVESWVRSSPEYLRRVQQNTLPYAWESLARWRSRGKCEWA